MSYGQMSAPGGYPYTAIPPAYAYPGSAAAAAAAYYYHPTALTNVASSYHRPTVFNFPPVAGATSLASHIQGIPSTTASAPQITSSAPVTETLKIAV